MRQEYGVLAPTTRIGGFGIMWDLGERHGVAPQILLFAMLVLAGAQVVAVLEAIL